MQQQQQQQQQPQQQQTTTGMPQQQMQYPGYSFSTGGMPTSQQQQLELQQLQLQQQQQMLNGQGGYLQQGLSTNGFTPATLSVPGNNMSMQLQQQQLPVQAIRPIQPVQVNKL